jgi:hypothetical protein
MKTVVDQQGVISVPKAKIGIVPILLSVFSLAVIVIGGVSVIFLQNSLKIARDPRNQASVGEKGIALDGCVISGCNSELCGEKGGPDVSICLYKPEFSCYKSGVCKKTDGKCGWVQTDALKTCIAQKGVTAPVTGFKVVDQPTGTKVATSEIYTHASDNQEGTALATDGNYNTAWESKASAPRWIQLDLKNDITLSTLTLVTKQETAGPTVYQISVGNPIAGGGMQENRVARIESSTTDGQKLNIQFEPAIKNVRYLFIATEQSPSPVAWNEIEIYKGDTLPSPIPGRGCTSNAECGPNQECYHPPYNCPPGAQCFVGPQPNYCRLISSPIPLPSPCVPRPACLDAYPACKIAIRPDFCPSAHPIKWSTPYASLTASDFYIQANGKKFYGTPTSVSVHSDPGDQNYTTLEMTWNENNVEMRLFIYFKQIDGKWSVTEMRTYDGQPSGNWFYYAGSVFGENAVGQAFKKPELQVISSDITGNNYGQVYFKNLSLMGFVPRPSPTPSQYGYTLEPVPVNPITTTLSANPESGYSVSALLKKDNRVVADQSDFIYSWSVSDWSIANVRPESHCVQGMQSPCPTNYALVRGIKPGSVKAFVKIIQKSTSIEVDSTEFNFTFKNSSPQPSPFPTPVPGGKCATNKDCPANYICYQPPMPPCPPGMACAQMMPAKYCKSIASPVPSPTPRPSICPTFMACPAPRQGCTYLRTGDSCGCGTLICTTPSPSPSACPVIACATTPNCSYVKNPNDVCSCGTLVCVNPSANPSPSPSPSPSGSPSPSASPGCITRPACLDETPACQLTPPIGGQFCPPTFADADFNHDGKVNLLDYSVLTDEFMTTGTNLTSDLNKDGKVDLRDYSLFITQFKLS